MRPLKNVSTAFRALIEFPVESDGGRAKNVVTVNIAVNMLLAIVYIIYYRIIIIIISVVVFYLQCICINVRIAYKYIVNIRSLVADKHLT